MSLADQSGTMRTLRKNVRLYVLPAWANGIVYKSRGGQGYLQKISSGIYVKSTDVVEDGVEYVVTNL